MKIKIKPLKKLAEIEVPDGYPMDASEWTQYVKNYKRIGQALPQHAAGLLKHGIDMRGAKRLGSGEYGNAYLLKSGDILKLTGDEAEAVTSNYMIGKNAKHIVNVKDVFKFPTKQRLYGILQERLYPLSPSESEQIDVAIRSLARVIGGDWYVFSRSWEEIKSLVEDTLTKERDPTADAKEIAFIRNHMSFMEKIGFGGVTDDLFENEIQYGDFHGGNFMRRSDKTLVLIDLGADSTVPNGAAAQIKPL